MHNKAFTPDNAAMLPIDHQVVTMAWTHSSDINLVKRNALRLARIARAVGKPRDGDQLVSASRFLCVVKGVLK